MRDDIELNALVSYVYDRLDEAKLAKQQIESRMIENLYYYRAEYTPEKLSSIRQLGGSEIYLPIANIKVRALKAWLTDIFFPETGEPPFDIEPTPVPELPSNVQSELESRLTSDINEIIANAYRVQQLSNGAFDPQLILNRIPEMIKREKESIQNKVIEEAKKLAEKEKRRIYDQFVEGGFFEALNEVLNDIGIFPSAFMKVCVPRRVKAFNKDLSPTFKVIPTFNRVSPFDIYPSPHVSDFSDWIIEILHLAPHDLASLKSVEGFDADAIDIVLGLYADTGFSIELGRQSEIRKLEGKQTVSSNLIDVIEFWGTLRGSLLRDYIDGIEDNEYYDVALWVCDNYVLKAILNPDPIGQKPYCKVSFIELPSSFWGLSLIDVIKGLQDGANAEARAVINNSALSSGPMIERNVDRIPRDEPKMVIPWKIFDSHDLGMSGAPAYRFYQPQLTANALIQVLMYFIRLADELSGVPPYTHTLVNAGGAVRTATGLSMMMESSSRGLKDIVKSIDVGIIEPAVRRQYYLNLINFYGNTEDVPDLNIKAKGSVTLMNRMAQISKVLQLLQITNNPIDLQLLGLETRRYLLENVFSGFGVSVQSEAQFEPLMQMLQQQLASGNLKAGQAAPNQAMATEEPANPQQAQLLAQSPPQEGGW